MSELIEIDCRKESMEDLIKKSIDEKKEDQEVFSITWNDCSYSVYVAIGDQDDLYEKLHKLFSKYA